MPAGGVEFRESRAAKGKLAAIDRTARSDKLEVKTKPGFGDLERADFHTNVHFTDGPKTQADAPTAVYDIAQVFAEPQVKARGVKIELEHPSAGKVPLVASPMRFSGTPLEYRQAPPVLGQHTDEVLKGLLGKSDAEIQDLRAAGIL